MIYDDLRGSNKILISGTHVLRAISLCMLYRKIPEKTCALLLQFFFLLLVFFCYWGNGFLLPSSRRSRWSVINFLCSSCRQSGFWGQPTHIHGEGLLSILDPNTTKRKRSFLRIIFRKLLLENHSKSLNLQLCPERIGLDLL